MNKIFCFLSSYQSVYQQGQENKLYILYYHFFDVDVENTGILFGEDEEDDNKAREN